MEPPIPDDPANNDPVHADRVGTDPVRADPVHAGAAHGVAASSWARMVEEAPELAAAITERFNANLHHVLGTTRTDGSPRLSGSEVKIDSSGVEIGMMHDAHKLDDVRRDPRVEIHSAPIEDDLRHGDAKLSGVLVQLPVTEDQPGAMFTLDITRASLVKVVGDELEFTTWSPSEGLRVQRRK